MQETVLNSGLLSIWVLIALVLILTGGVWLLTYLIDNFLWTPNDREIS